MGRKPATKVAENETTNVTAGAEESLTVTSEKASDVTEKASDVTEKASDASEKASDVTENTSDVTEKASDASKKTSKSTKPATEKKKAGRPAGKTTAKEAKGELKPELFLQFQNKESVMDDAIQAAKNQYVAAGHRVSSIKSLQVYFKPEENAAYYVINQKFAGKVELF